MKDHCLGNNLVLENNSSTANFIMEIIVKTMYSGAGNEM